MKKIIFLSNTFYPEHGAAPNRLLHTALGLQKAGYQIEVITGIPHYPHGKFSRRYKNKFYQEEIHQGIRIHRFWLYPSHSDSLKERFLTMFSLAFSVILAIPFLFIKKKVDYLFLQYPPVAMVFPTLILQKLTKAKLIVNVSDLWPLAIEELGFTKQKSVAYWLMKKIEGLAYKKAEILLAQSNEIKAYLETANSHKKVILYRTGVNCHQFKPNFANKKDSPKIKIVYAGVLGVAHGMAQVCKNMQLPNSDAELHIFGEGFEKKAIDAYIHQHLHKNIFLHEMLSQDKLVQQLETADIILIAQKARIYGTVPSKIYDAMAMGKPILFHGAGEGAEIIRQAGCGFISQPNDFNKLNEHLKILIESASSFREKLGKKGRKAAEENFDRKIYLKSLIKAVNNLELGKVEQANQQSYVKNFFF